MSDVRLVGKIDSRKLVPCFNENNRIPANMISESNAILSFGVKALRELHDCGIENFVLPSEEITERLWKNKNVKEYGEKTDKVETCEFPERMCYYEWRNTKSLIIKFPANKRS